MKILTLLISFILIGGVAFSQGKSQEAKGKNKIENKGNQKLKEHKGKPDNSKKVNDHKKHNKSDVSNKDKSEKTNNGKGHAYGKDKEGLSGREFGQKRSGEAKAGKDIKDDEEAEEIIHQVEEENQVILQEVKNKLEKARDILEKAKGEMEPAVFEERSLIIETIERKKKELEKLITL